MHLGASAAVPNDQHLPDSQHKALTVFVRNISFYGEEREIVSISVKCVPQILGWTRV